MWRSEARAGTPNRVRDPASGWIPGRGDGRIGAVWPPVQPARDECSPDAAIPQSLVCPLFPTIAASVAIAPKYPRPSPKQSVHWETAAATGAGYRLCNACPGLPRSRWPECAVRRPVRAPRQGAARMAPSRAWVSEDCRATPAARPDPAEDGGGPAARHADVPHAPG